MRQAASGRSAATAMAVDDDDETVNKGHVTADANADATAAVTSDATADETAGVTGDATADDVIMSAADATTTAEPSPSGAVLQQGSDVRADFGGALSPAELTTQKQQQQQDTPVSTVNSAAVAADNSTSSPADPSPGGSEQVPSHIYRVGQHVTTRQW